MFVTRSRSSFTTVTHLMTCAHRYAPEGPAHAEILRKSESSKHTVNCISSLNPNRNTLEPDRPQHNRPAACVIAQQYSSATFVSSCVHTCNEKLGVRFKTLFKTVFNCAGRVKTASPPRIPSHIFPTFYPASGTAKLCPRFHELIPRPNITGCSRLHHPDTVLGSCGPWPYNIFRRIKKIKTTNINQFRYFNYYYIRGFNDAPVSANTSKETSRLLCCCSPNPLLVFEGIHFESRQEHRLLCSVCLSPSSHMTESYLD
jgi:hypothetical protein